MIHTKLMFGSTRPTSNHLSFLQKILLILLIPLSWNAQAQHCPHPEDPNQIMGGNTFTTVAATATTNAYVEINGVSGQGDEDGTIYDLSSLVTCNSATPHVLADSIASGATYGFVVEAGASYTFTACHNSTTNNDPDIYPNMDIWGLADTDFYVASTVSTTNGITCSELVYTNTQSCAEDEIFLNVRTRNHGLGNCLADWRKWDLSITCTSCTLTAGSAITVGAGTNTSASACTAVTANGTTGGGNIPPYEASRGD